MKGYIKVGLILEVESKDLGDEIWMIEKWVLDELDDVKIQKNIKIVEQIIDAHQFKKGTSMGFEDLY